MGEARGQQSGAGPSERSPRDLDRGASSSRRPGRSRSRLGRALRFLAWSSAALAGACAIAWAALALAVDGPGTLGAAAFVALALLGLALVRPRAARPLVVAVLFAAVLVWWLAIEPRNDRDWLAEVERTSTMAIDGERLTVSNLHDFEYRTATDFTPRWEERSYDLARVRGVDLFLCDWGAPIVHTILSWEFEGGEHLAISIETRKEQGESYSALRGFFRQFELYYAVGDERDVIGVRTNQRGARVRLYRMKVPPADARELLRVYAARVDELARAPDWYNALTHNCTTSIRLHAQELGIPRPWDWRVLANGRVDELLHERGMIDATLPFEELRARSEITARARAGPLDAGFSARIRADLPPGPAR